MSDLSKKARKLIDDVTSETTNAWDEYGLSPAEYDLWQAVDPMRSTGIYKPHGDGPSLLASLCDEIEALEKENARLKLIAENAPLLDTMGRGVGNPLDRLENEHAALRVECEYLRDAVALGVNASGPSWRFSLWESTPSGGIIEMNGPFESMTGAVGFARAKWLASTPEVRARWAPNYVGPK